MGLDLFCTFTVMAFHDAVISSPISEVNTDQLEVPLLTMVYKKVKKSIAGIIIETTALKKTDQASYLF